MFQVRVFGDFKLASGMSIEVIGNTTAAFLAALTFVVIGLYLLSMLEEMAERSTVPGYATIFQFIRLAVVGAVLIYFI